jgi:hypothetical protein
MWPWVQTPVLPRKDWTSSHIQGAYDWLVAKDLSGFFLTGLMGVETTLADTLKLNMLWQSLLSRGLQSNLKEQKDPSVAQELCHWQHVTGHRKGWGNDDWELELSTQDFLKFLNYIGKTAVFPLPLPSNTWDCSHTSPCAELLMP